MIQKCCLSNSTVWMGQEEATVAYFNTGLQPISN
jgi:hypothetical protein